MGCERQDVRGVDGLRECRAWHNGRVTVTVGQMPAGDDRWFAWHSGKDRAYVFSVERPACELAQRWLGRGAWTRVEAFPTPQESY